MKPVDTSLLKKQAAEYAVTQFVQSGMLVGLGFGSTAVHAVRKIADLLQTGGLKNISAIACAKYTEDYARQLGIPLIEFAPDTEIDITIDGADEVDPNFNLIKGGGGALTREKIVAAASRREVIVVDENKLSERLGTNWPVPIEVIPFGWQTQIRFLRNLGADPVLRVDQDGQPVITDQHNYILDANFGQITNPEFLADRIKAHPGIVEHGLFIGLATDIVIASPSGINHLQKETKLE
ncbi:MAG: ribose-5-phosphate isomerase RpiA [Anaerolineales bacterium]|nr:ribose-5-phosphate isomerase RpiA [Anaerolineales bacterium]